MNDFCYSFGWVTIIAIITGCQPETNSDGDPNAQTTLINEFKLEPEVTEKFSSYRTHFTTSPTDEIISILNLENPPHAVTFDYDGEFIGRYGTEGSGPGELESAISLGLDDQNNAVIYDFRQKMLNRYYPNSDSSSSYKIPTANDLDITSSRSLQPCNDIWYLAIDHLDSEPVPTTPIIGKFNDDFELQKTFGGYDPFFGGQQDIRQNPVISVDCEKKRIYTGHSKLPFIQIYSMEDYSKQKRIDNTPSSFMLSSDFTETIYNMADWQEHLINEQSTNLFLDSGDDYIINGFINGTEEFFDDHNYLKRDNFIAVYDRRDYTYYGEIELQGYYAGMTKEGYILHVIDDNPENFTIRMEQIKVE